MKSRPTTPKRKPDKSTTRPRGRPKRATNFVQPLLRIVAMCQRLKLSGAFFTFRDIAEALTKRAGVRIYPADIIRLERGVEPARADKRKALGLPILSPAPVCPLHGVVHITKRCPSTTPHTRSKPKSFDFLLSRQIMKQTRKPDRLPALNVTVDKAAAEYDKWLTRNAARLAGIVAWAEANHG